MRKKTMYDILIQAVCIFCALLILFPILYAASVSFMEQKDVLSSPPNLLPPKPTLENYKTAFSRTMLLRYMLNSFIVASICSVARMVLVFRVPRNIRNSTVLVFWRLTQA